MFYVYAIKSDNRNYIYIGMTNNLERRFNQHNKGYNKSTKPYAPFSLIHYEIFNTSAEARFREKKLKTAAGKRFLRAKYNL